MPTAASSTPCGSTIIDSPTPSGGGWSAAATKTVFSIARAWISVRQWCSLSGPRTHPIPRMIMVWIATMIPCCTSLPPINADRLTGDTRNRSRTPRSRSSIMLMPLHPAVNSAVMITMPGTRNVM